MSENINVEIVVDDREHKLIDLLKNTNEIAIEHLDIGDILFRMGGETVLIIERKTTSDLKASICDGRHREQKARLLGSGTPTNRIMYLIEGSLDKPLNSNLHNISVSTLVGSLINTQLRDNIKVYKTNSLNETAEFIRKLSDKLNKDYNSFFKDGDKIITQSDYSSTLKKQKKANMTPIVWFVSQLSLIPQVSDVIAKVIIEEYPTPDALFTSYQDISEDLRDRMLAEITYSTKTGKSRRVGDKISSRIYKFFYGIVD